MSAKKRVHVSLPVPVLEGLEALAVLRGQALSDLIEDIGRGELESKGISPKITAADIEKEIARRKKRK